MLDENTIKNLLKHDFEFISELGSGGFGNVVKVKHQISKQFFAVKRLNNNRKENPDNILREIQAIARFDHPNIINYNHSFIEDNELYLVMEYCSKGSLRNWLSKKGKFNIDHAIDIFLKLTQAFDFLHKKDYVHHDIKPENILLTEDFNIKISDFGTVNTKIGTIIYSAPEMLMSDPSENDVRVDVFSLGITFMECITGENPFEKCNFQEQIFMVKRANFPIKQLPYWLQQLLLKACHYDPSARFQSMIEFHNAISKRHIPQIINNNVIDSNKLSNKLKMYLVGRRWQKAKSFIEINNDESIGFMIQKGKYFLGTNQLIKAKSTFEKILKKDQNAPIEKNISEIYLQFEEPSKAATILHGYISNHFNDIEAHNQLLHSYFLSDQWELGLDQAEYLRKLFPKETVFVNNRILFELLLDKEPFEIEFLTEKNPIGYYNYHEVVNGNNPSAYDKSDKKHLKSKLLFHEYKFKNIHKSKNTVAIEIDGEIHHCDKHIISFGRKGYDYNTFSYFDDNQISRRHFLILNQRNNVWLYDLSSFGTFVDGKKVNKKAFLLGRCEIKFGNYQVFIKSDTNLLL
jgi:serine/threonine protein kinase